MTDNNSTTAIPEQPSIWQNLWAKIVRPRPTGVSCEYCGWNGPADQLIKAPRMNEDGVVYQINTCPSCMRNGGLLFYD